MSSIETSWNGLPLIKKAIEQYKGFGLIVDMGNEIIISYRATWYTLTNNGGEIIVEKINGSFIDNGEFPTVHSKFGGLNAETLMYRLKATLDGNPIDYNHIEKVILA